MADETLDDTTDGTTDRRSDEEIDCRSDEETHARPGEETDDRLLGEADAVLEDATGTDHETDPTPGSRTAPTYARGPDGTWGSELPAPERNFSDDVTDRHLRLNGDDYDEIYVVGDVHGCISELRTLWQELAPSDDDLVVFVGDLIRKGPASTEVVEFVTSRPNALSVVGNNEAKVLHDRIDTEPFEPIRAELESFPLVVSWDDAMVVHGGVHPERPLADLDADDLLETRSVPPEAGYDGPFWFDQYRGPPRVFFGHTVLATPRRREWAVGLDTGCVYGGDLTAYDYRREDVISVPAERTYEERAERKILD